MRCQLGIKAHQNAETMPLRAMGMGRLNKDLRGLAALKIQGVILLGKIPVLPEIDECFRGGLIF
jgi:hypothetical protein